MLNWHPVVEYEIREIERERWLQQLRSEEQQLAKEDERLAELDAKIAALWPSSTSSSHQTPPPERDSPT